MANGLYVLFFSSYVYVVVGDRIYKAVLNRGTPEETRALSERHFCSKCSAMLWLWDETWCVTLPLTLNDSFDSYRPEYLHPFASAIDEPDLKVPEEMVRVNRNRELHVVDARTEPICVDGAHDGIGTGICAPA